MNNFYYGNENMPGVNNILGVDEDRYDYDYKHDPTPEPAPVIPKELDKNIDLSKNELFKKSLNNRNKSIRF